MRYFAKAESIARWSTFLLFFLAPFFFVPVPWMSIAQGKVLLSVVVVTVGFLAWIAMSLKDSEFSIPKSPLFLAAFLVPVAYLVSALVASPSFASLVGDGGGEDTVIGFTIWYLALFLSAVVCGAQADRPTRALRLLLGSALVVLVVQIARLVFPVFTFGGALASPASSVLGSWHDLAIYFALMLFLSLALLSSSAARGVWRYVAIIVALGSFVLLLVISYADAWLAVCGGALLYSLFHFRSPLSGARFGPRSVSLAYLALAAASLVLFFGGSQIQRSFPAPLQITQVEVRPSWQGSFTIGREVFAEPTQLFFGSGPNTFPRDWGRYKPLSVNETQFWNTDFYYGVGFIPTSLVTTGIAGAIAWLSVCAVLLWSLVRLLRYPHSVSHLRAILAIGAALLTAYHILYVPGPALLLLNFLLLGALIGEELGSGSIPRVRWSLPWETLRGKVGAVALSLIGLLFLFGSVQSLRALVSDILVNRAVAHYRATEDIGGASRSLTVALTVLPGSDKAHRAGVELGLLQLSRLIAASDGGTDARSELQGTLNATIQHGLAAVAIESRDYQNWLTLARLYSELAGAGISGAEEQARSAYVEAAAKSPTTPLPYLGLAQLDLLRGDDVGARTNLEKAIEIKADLAPAHFLLSQIDARANALQEALQHAGVAVQIAPQDPLGWYNLGTMLYASNDYGNAVTALERAVALEENYANALYLLGLSYYRLERVDDSLRALRAVAATNQDNAALNEIIEDIDAGRDPFTPAGR
ncbi:tetratricopeptide repeat protein [Candidatus Kaiserbacteria bacterium]|nr:tetratricopeptide repeat protein [Candidatus Kaiserbacteria bacterium]